MKLYGVEERPTNVVRYWIKKYFKGRCLDVGCGKGRHLKLMPEGSIGIDIFPVKLDRYDFLACDVNYGLPFKDESFDCILASHIIEHVESPYGLLREFWRILKKGGWLIVAIPNPQCLFFDYYELYEPWNEHIYSWDIKSMKRFLMNSGFEVVEIYCNFPFNEKVGRIFQLFKNFMFDLWFVSRKVEIGSFKLRSKRNIVFGKIFVKCKGAMSGD